MRDQDYTLSLDFLSGLFSGVTQQVELRACPNVKGEPGAAQIFTRSRTEMQRFCERRDVDGIGTYFGVCTRREGAKNGGLEDIVECVALWADIDCLKQGIPGDEAIRALDFLPFPPSIVVNSGGGLHAYWQLEEAINVTVGSQQCEHVVSALKSLARVVAGDMKVCDLARIMRLPGTRNSKAETIDFYGEAATCSVISSSGRVYDFGEMVEWLKDQRSVLQGNAPISLKPVRDEADPFVRYAREEGFELALDIDDELAAMTHGAAGNNSIHQTQLRVSASMLARGYEDDEIIDRLLRATEAAAPPDRTWNWNAEEKAIRGMIASARKKGFDRKADKPAVRPAADGNTALKLVHDADAEERPAQRPDAEQKKLDEISALGTAVLGVWTERYGPIIHSGGTTYAYEGGVWSVWDEQHDQMLRVLLQEACVSLGKAPKTALLNAATVFFMNRPSLLVRDVEFDRHGLIVAEDGTVDPRNLEIGEHNPGHRAMFKVGARLEGARDCPAFIAFLRDCFADRDDAEVEDIIRTVQEWFGAALVANKSRALAKGMLVYGPSRTGKTQLSEILRALLGRNQTCATSAGDIGSDFGLQPFLGKRGWVADDAIGQSEYLDAERYKKIVTGEEIGVRRKNRTDVMARFGFPVMLTANNLPRVKDQSDAVYNRSLVLPMTKVRPETLPEPAGYQSIAEKIISEELTGVLWWAIEGWKRLSARGVFIEPSCMKKAVTDLKDSNNPVAAWMRESLVADSENKVAKADLFASFAGWYYLENGDGKFPWSQNGFGRRIKEMMPQIGDQAGVKTRNFTGLRLTEIGLEYWSVNASREGVFVPKGTVVEPEMVNQPYSILKAERAAEQHENTDRRPRF